MHTSFRRGPCLRSKVIAFAVLAVCAVPVLAQTSFDKIRNRGQINIGYREDAAPFSYLDDRKKAIGYSIDFCNAVAARLATDLGKDLRVNMVPIAIDRVIPFVRNGSVDLLCTGTSDTPQRRTQVSFSKPIYLDGVGVMVRRKDGITSLGQLHGKQISVIKTSTSNAALDAFRQKKSTAWKIEPALNADAALNQLQLGWVQGYARDKVLLAMQLATLSDGDQYAILPEHLSTEAIAIVVRKDDAELLALVNSVVTQAVANGNAKAWYDKWFVDPIPLYKKRTALGIPMSAELKASFEASR